jgi:hypothetical protein
MPPAHRVFSAAQPDEGVWPLAKRELANSCLNNADELVEDILGSIEGNWRRELVKGIGCHRPIVLELFGIHIDFLRAAEGCFFLRKKPLECVLSVYTNSEMLRRSSETAGPCCRVAPSHGDSTLAASQPNP